MVLKTMITGICAYNLNKLHDELISFGVGKWEEFETKFNKNFAKYYESASRTCSIVPFSLTPNKKIKLLDIYQSFNLEYNENPQGYISITTDSVENILNISKHAWIYGHGGIGKSTMLKYFFLKALSDSENKVDYRIPVYIELRRYNQEEFRGKTFLEFLYNVMRNSNFDLEYKYFEFMIKKGRFIFLLDAFDEVISQHQEAVAYGISDLMTQYHENSVLVTSRKLTERYVNAQNDMISLETNGLNKEQAVSLIKKVSKKKIVISKEVTHSFLSQLNEELYEEYESFASNPILLLLMLQTFQANQDFPKQESAFLLESFDCLFNKHDASKNVAFKREYKTKLTKSILRKVLSHFCFRLYYKEEESYELSREKLESILEDVLEYENCTGISVTDLINDFIVCLSLLHCEGGNYYFVHNIFKEFFCSILSI
ncbi:TPA: NACHT domain-containing protein [Streptococcus suis]|nr:NACHT domain-containing protein [Streptococcus suis]